MIKRLRWCFEGDALRFGLRYRLKKFCGLKAEMILTALIYYEYSNGLGPSFQIVPQLFFNYDLKTSCVKKSICIDPW